jgi:hypothetical protein
MLKLTYTEAGLHMEQVTTPLETLMTQRVTLALRCGHSLYVESGRASFLLRQDTPGLAHLQAALWQERSHNVAIAPVDAQFVEVSLSGSWVAENAAAHAGIFLVALSDYRTEFFVYKLWLESQMQISSLA